MPQLVLHLEGEELCLGWGRASSKGLLRTLRRTEPEPEPVFFRNWGECQWHPARPRHPAAWGSEQSPSVSEAARGLLLLKYSQIHQKRPPQAAHVTFLWKSGLPAQASNSQKFCGEHVKHRSQATGELIVFNEDPLRHPPPQGSCSRGSPGPLGSRDAAGPGSATSGSPAEPWAGRWGGDGTPCSPRGTPPPPSRTPVRGHGVTLAGHEVPEPTLRRAKPRLPPARPPAGDPAATKAPGHARDRRGGPEGLGRRQPGRAALPPSRPRRLFPPAGRYVPGRTARLGAAADPGGPRGLPWRRGSGRRARGAACGEGGAGGGAALGGGPTRSPPSAARRGPSALIAAGAGAAALGRRRHAQVGPGAAAAHVAGRDGTGGGARARGRAGAPALSGSAQPGAAAAAAPGPAWGSRAGGAVPAAGRGSVLLAGRAWARPAAAPPGSADRGISRRWRVWPGPAFRRPQPGGAGRPGFCSCSGPAAWLRVPRAPCPERPRLRDGSVSPGSPRRRHRRPGRREQPPVAGSRRGQGRPPRALVPVTSLGGARALRGDGWAGGSGGRLVASGVPG